MLDETKDGERQGDAPASEAVRDDAMESEPSAGVKSPDSSPPAFDESIVEEIGALIDNAKLYTTAELAFQKTRARLLGKSVGVALGAVILAIILLHIALISMAVGFVIALEPLVTIWGAIALVVGAMLLGVGALAYAAVSRGRLILEMFAGPPKDPSSEENEA
ncbi:MAG: phage holin family protein [Pseudomonadota bacterium]